MKKPQKDKRTHWILKGPGRSKKTWRTAAKYTKAEIVEGFNSKPVRRSP
jgi:hypothetical protein